MENNKAFDAIDACSENFDRDLEGVDQVAFFDEIIFKSQTVYFFNVTNLYLVFDSY